jgi:hypothetical protein
MHISGLGSTFFDRLCSAEMAGSTFGSGFSPKIAKTAKIPAVKSTNINMPSVFLLMPDSLPA